MSALVCANIYYKLAVIITIPSVYSAGWGVCVTLGQVASSPQSPLARSAPGAHEAVVRCPILLLAHPDIFLLCEDEHLSLCVVGQGGGVSKIWLGFRKLPLSILQLTLCI